MAYGIEFKIFGGGASGSVGACVTRTTENQMGNRQ